MNYDRFAELAAALWASGLFFVSVCWALAFGFTFFSYRSIRRRDAYRG